MSETIDTFEAAKILQVSGSRAALVILKREGVKLTEGRHGWLASRAEVVALANRRGGKIGPGRPRKNNSQKAINALV